MTGCTDHSSALSSQPGFHVCTFLKELPVFAFAYVFVIVILIVLVNVIRLLPLAGLQAGSLH